MTKRTAIGISGVIAEVAWMHVNSRFPVDKSILITNLCNRYSVNQDIAEVAIDIAKRCGVVEETELCIKIKPRPK